MNLSYQLALALGYPSECVRACDANETSPNENELTPHAKVWHTGPFADVHYWVTFNYTDPSVALPVLERLMENFDVCPHMGPDGRYWMWLSADVIADTLPEAIALAAIEVSK